MFGSDDHRDATDAGTTPVADAAQAMNNPPVSNQPQDNFAPGAAAPAVAPSEKPVISPISQPADPPAPTFDPTAPVAPAPEPAQPPASTDAILSMPINAPAIGSDDLLELKQNALEQLKPLVDHLDSVPEEKFDALMMMIRASDDHSLVQPAYDTAQKITDDKKRAEALLDVVNEINYLTSSQQ